jgi:hypothetical protein
MLDSSVTSESEAIPKASMTSLDSKSLAKRAIERDRRFYDSATQILLPENTNLPPVYFGLPSDGGIGQPILPLAQRGIEVDETSIPGRML